MAVIDKRGNKYRVRVRRKGYPTQTKTFSSKAAAETWVRQVEGDMDRGVFVDRTEAERTTLKEALERYEREVTPAKKGAKQEKQRIARWKKHSLSARSLASIRSTDIAEHRDSRLAEGKAPQTVINELNVLSHLFEVAAKEWGIGVVNPCKAVRKPARNEGRDRRMTLAEEKKLLKMASGDLGPFITLAVETGMRRGELVGLFWSWVDLKSRVIRLPDTKNGSRRDVPLSTRAITALESLPRQLDGRVFGWSSADSATHAFKDACEAAGIDDLRLHDLRHEATSRLVESGKFNLVEIAAITGHKTMVMLKRYSHPRAEDLAARLM